MCKALAKRYRVNRELLEGVGGEGEERKGRWLRRMVEMVARGLGGGRGVAVDEVGEMAMMIEVGHLGEVAASFLVGQGRLRRC